MVTTLEDALLLIEGLQVRLRTLQAKALCECPPPGPGEYRTVLDSFPPLCGKCRRRLYDARGYMEGRRDGEAATNIKAYYDEIVGLSNSLDAEERENDRLRIEVAALKQELNEHKQKTKKRKG